MGWRGKTARAGSSIPESSLTVLPLVPGIAAGGDELDIAIIVLRFKFAV